MPTPQEREQCQHGSRFGSDGRCSTCADLVRLEAEQTAAFRAKLQEIEARLITNPSFYESGVPRLHDGAIDVKALIKMLQL